MLSVIIPTLNAEDHLGRNFAALVGAIVRGRLGEVIVADGGSEDGTAAIADAAGAKLIATACNRGGQMAAGAQASRGDWLVFLHPDTILEAGWDDEVAGFIDRVERGAFGQRDMAAVFSYRVDHFSRRARLMEWLVALRCLLFSLPRGNQGLLISRRFYNRLGGHSPIDGMEDVDLMRRIGRRHFICLRTRAINSAQRYESRGFFSRLGPNIGLVMLYNLRVPTRWLARFYG